MNRQPRPNAKRLVTESHHVRDYRQQEHGDQSQQGNRCHTEYHVAFFGFNHGRHGHNCRAAADGGADTQQRTCFLSDNLSQFGQELHQRQRQADFKNAHGDADESQLDDGKNPAARRAG